jgi:predicted Zn-ribbon and HTH transcriptional regulator
MYEKAIETFENVINHWSYKFRKDLTEHKAGELALDCLREAQERQKGCGHCFAITPDDCKNWTVFNDKIETIRFCPMCGRKLC